MLELGELIYVPTNLARAYARPMGIRANVLYIKVMKLEIPSRVDRSSPTNATWLEECFGITLHKYSRCEGHAMARL